MEEVPLRAIRCRYCGSNLAPTARKRRNWLALFFFLTSLALGILCWYQQSQINIQRNRIDDLEYMLEEAGANAGSTDFEEY